jgi:hypothetical protein
MIIFQNPGAIDLDAALLMGVNAKTSTNPIGFFGSGLKYAIAVLLRTNHKVVIFRGTQPFHFTTEERVSRGTKYHPIVMNGQALGFTMELGKNWAVWEAFRELYCNATDENGSADQLAIGDNLDAIVLLPNTTTVAVIGTEIEELWPRHGDFILLKEPEICTTNVDIIRKPSKNLYYRGILVQTHQKEWPHTYNIKGFIDLTENRGVKYDFQVRKLLVKCTDELLEMGLEDVVERMLTPESSSSPHASLEWGGVFDDDRRPQAWSDLVGRLMKTSSYDIPTAAKSTFTRMMRSTSIEPTPKDLTSVEQQMLDRAIRFCQSIGYNPTQYPIIPVDRVGDGIYGLAKNGKIYITDQAFRQGTKQVAATMVEEFLHLHMHFVDETRTFQNYLFEKIMSLGEELTGEPL